MKRVGILFSGGPAPASNAVIGAAASAFRRSGREVVGLLHGYSGLQTYDRASRPLVPEEDYHVFADRDLWGLRNTRGVFVGTGRANPGKGIATARDLDDPAKTDRLRRVYEALVDLDIDALVSIGGDDTLRTANCLYEFQRRLPDGSPARARRPRPQDHRQRLPRHRLHVRLLHGRRRHGQRAPQPARRRDGDEQLLHRRDHGPQGRAGSPTASPSPARRTWSSRSRTSSASSPRKRRCTTPRRARRGPRPSSPIDRLADHIVDLILTRERRGKRYGTVVLAEGLAEMLPEAYLRDVARDDHGHVSLGRIDIGKLVAKVAAERVRAAAPARRRSSPACSSATSRAARRRTRSTCVLGSQLGLGAFHALTEKGLDGHMVSVSGQLDLRYVPFSELIDPDDAPSRGPLRQARQRLSPPGRGARDEDHARVTRMTIPSDSRRVP